MRSSDFLAGHKQAELVKPESRRAFDLVFSRFVVCGFKYVGGVCLARRLNSNERIHIGQSF